jgi:hypothetical protein
MPSQDPLIENDLGRLHHLARELFYTVRDEYDPPAHLTVHVEECDDLGENPHVADAALRVLIDAQLLRQATRTARIANPRHVIALALLADDLIPSLLDERRNTSPAVADRMHEIRKAICEICDRLLMATPPGADRFPC